MLKIKENQFSTSGEFLRKLISVFYIFIGFPLGFFTYIFLANYEYTRIHPQFRIGEIIAGIETALVILLVFYAYRTFKRKRLLLTSGTLKERLVKYYTISVRLYIILDIALLITVLLYYFTIENTLIPAIALLIGMCSVQSPNLVRIARHLQLKKEEKEVILKGVSIEN